MLLKKIRHLSNEIKKIHQSFQEIDNLVNKINELEKITLKISKENDSLKKDCYILAYYINNIHYLIEESIKHDMFDYDNLKNIKKEEYH